MIQSYKYSRRDFAHFLLPPERIPYFDLQSFKDCFKCIKSQILLANFQSLKG
jgi:hypothetical protein